MKRQRGRGREREKRRGLLLLTCRLAETRVYDSRIFDGLEGEDRPRVIKGELGRERNLTIGLGRYVLRNIYPYTCTHVCPQDARGCGKDGGDVPRAVLESIIAMLAGLRKEDGDGQNGRYISAEWRLCGDQLSS